MSRWRAALPLILLILAGVVLLYSGALDRFHPARLVADEASMRASVASHPWMSGLTYIGLLTLAVSTGIPGTVVIIFAGGLVFGVAQGTMLSSVALTLGSLLLFLASRYAFGSGSKTPPPLVEKLRHGFSNHPVSYTLALRFIPVMPFGAVTLALAWLRCPLWLFIGATWLGGTVSLIFETSVGAGLGEALGSGQNVGPGLLLEPHLLLPLCALAVLALLPLTINAVRARMEKRRNR
ncbi:VTT domain-containing protein [Luteibacter sp. Sphag1AF]|uniref:TVP38/TMEM64 family protein n=1 Tax=Luteibacter sp. Sphag1AF TaxID=2587031 RepID=UPI0016226848|nr:VTT domain-containing protein [Luteibacter sp. Sphag1AF]